MCIRSGTLVRSFQDKSINCRELKLWASSWGIDGSSLPDKRSSRKYGKWSSGTVVKETFARPSFTRLLSRPKNALSITFNSSLFDKSSVDKRGSVAKAASSRRYKWLLERSRLDKDWNKKHVNMISIFFFYSFINNKFTLNLFDKSMLCMDAMELCERSSSHRDNAAKFDSDTTGIFVSELCDKSSL